MEWTEQWKRQGLEEGRQQGRQEGEAPILLRLLERKFGPLDAATRQRIATADADTLLEWGDRLLTADCLTKVFDNL